MFTTNEKKNANKHDFGFAIIQFNWYSQSQMYNLLYNIIMKDHSHTIVKTSSCVQYKTLSFFKDNNRKATQIAHTLSPALPSKGTQKGMDVWIKYM